MSGETVKVATIENEIEAGLLGSVLVERSIPHTLRSYRDSAYDGIYQVQKGWGAVYAPADYKEQILEILADIRHEPASCEPSEESEQIGQTIGDGQYSEQGEDTR